MKLKGILLFLSVTFLVLIGVSTSAYASDSSVDDQANLFTDEQIAQLKEQIRSIEVKTKATFFIVTNTNNETDSTEFADYYMLDRIGKNQNGVTFYIDMNQRHFIISTSGNMIDYLTDARIRTLITDIKPSMKQRSYYEATQTFLKETSLYFDQGIPNRHYRVDTETGKVTYYRSLSKVKIIVSVLLALVISSLFLLLNIYKYQLKIGTYKYPFKEKASVDLSLLNDQLVDSFVTTRHIPRNNSGSGGVGGGGSSTHTTGGGTFGGGGSSF